MVLVLLGLILVQLRLTTPYKKLLIHMCMQDSPPSDVEDPEAALSVLLGQKASRYQCDESQHGPAPFKSGNVSMPDFAGGCDLRHALTDSDPLDLEGFQKRFFLGDTQYHERVACEGSARSYWDPSELTVGLHMHMLLKVCSNVIWLFFV